MYIVFEGIDTAGKSTQVALLEKLFDHAVITKEPGGTDFGTIIREIVLGHEELDHMTELLLFLADRREHFTQVVKPALDQKKVLISDRSFISGIAYAFVNKTLDFEHLKALNLMTIDERLPDIVVLFELPRQTLIERLGMKEHDGIEKRGIDYLLQVQDALIRTTHKLGIKHLIVDASMPIEAIHEQIKNFIPKDIS